MFTLPGVHTVYSVREPCTAWPRRHQFGARPSQAKSTGVITMLCGEYVRSAPLADFPARPNAGQ